jgi:hypothetical protein
LIFFIIAFSGLVSYKASAREGAKAWKVKNQDEMEQFLRYVNFTICLSLTVLGILGMLGFVTVR